MASLIFLRICWDSLGSDSKGKVLVVSSLVRALLCHRHGGLDITGVHSLVLERGVSHRSVSKTRGFPTNANEYFHFTDFKVLNFIDELV